MNNAGSKPAAAPYEKIANKFSDTNKNRDTTISLVDPNADNLDLLQNTKPRLPPISEQKPGAYGIA